MGRKRKPEVLWDEDKKNFGSSAGGVHGYPVFVFLRKAGAIQNRKDPCGKMCIRDSHYTDREGVAAAYI